MNDTINRQEVIEILSLDKDMLNIVLDDMDVVGKEREKYSWGIKLIESIIEKIKQLSPTQPEIIYCENCKYKDDGIDEDGIPFLKCLHGRSYGKTRINDFCSWADRKEE